MRYRMVGIKAGATGATGAVPAPVEFVLEAADELIARKLARDQGYTVLRAHRLANALTGGFGSRGDASRNHAFPASLFAVELLALLRAGLNVVEATSTLASKEESARYQGQLESLVARMREGLSLSQALAREPSLPALFLAGIRAAERTGDVERALARYVDYAAQIEALKKKLVSAALYPSILIVVALAVMAFLMLYVVPRFSKIYEDMSGELPFFSGLLMSVGRWIDGHAWLSTALLALTITAIAVMLASVTLRARFLEALQRFPALGQRLKVFHLARLYRTLGMLLQSGIPLVEALATAEGVLPAHLRPRAVRTRERLSEGLAISAAFSQEDLVTPIATQLLAVGERTGEMGTMMARIADFYDEALGRWLDRAMKLAEPLLMVMIGLAIGGVVVLMYMPIFELAGSIQ